MGLGYVEVWYDNPEISKAEALVEFRKVELGEKELVEELGDRETYHAADVMRVLGY